MTKEEYKKALKEIIEILEPFDEIDRIGIAAGISTMVENHFLETYKELNSI